MNSLTVLQATDVEILAELPAADYRGTYLLIVRSGNAAWQIFAADVAIDMPQGILGYEKILVASGPLTLGPNGGASVTAECPVGKKVLGGGGLETTELVPLVRSYPPSETSWTVLFRNLTDTTVAGTTLQVFAICATVD